MKHDVLTHIYFSKHFPTSTLYGSGRKGRQEKLRCKDTLKYRKPRVWNAL